MHKFYAVLKSPQIPALPTACKCKGMKIAVHKSITPLWKITCHMGTMTFPREFNAELS